MAALSGLLLIAGIATVIYPIRSWGMSRPIGLFLFIGGIALSVTAAPSMKSVAGPAASTPKFSSTGSCRTDPLGAYRCDSEASFGALGSSSSHLVCKKNPLTGATDCKHEMSAN